MRSIFWIIVFVSFPWSARVEGAEGKTKAQDAPQSAFRDLADEIKTYLTGKEQKLRLLPFTPDPKGPLAGRVPQAGGELTRQLADQLRLRGIQPDDEDAKVVISGTFMEAEPLGSFRQGIQLDAIITDNGDGAVRGLSHHLVLNETFLVTILALHGDLGATDRDKKLKEIVDNSSKLETRPVPAIDGTKIRTSAKSPFAIELLKATGQNDPKKATPFDQFKIVTPENKKGFAFAPIERDEVYVVRIHNDGPFDVAVSLHLDGVSMFVLCDDSDPQTKMRLKDPATKTPLFNHIIVSAGRFVEVRGWFINREFSEEFRVVALENSVAAKLKQFGQVGAITACFHACVAKGKDGKFPAFPPGEPENNSQSVDGTGAGAKIGQKYEVVESKIGALRSFVSVRYSK